MRLSISSIANRGELNKERVVLKPKLDCELNGYVLAKSNYADADSIVAEARNAYWLPPKEVEVGDLVVVYTKAGTDSQKKREEGGTVYFFYRGLSAAQYGEKTACAVLFEVNEWQASKPGV